MALTTPPPERLRTALRWLAALVFLAAGAIHLARPAPFVGITPGWVPYPAFVIAFTGVCELLGAVALLIPRLRWWAGVMLAAYAVCVFPANVNHAIQHALTGAPPGWGYHVPRLLLGQPLIIWWVLFAGGVIDWPWRRRRVPG